MKKGDVIRQKCVNTTFYLTGILAHKVNNSVSLSPATYHLLFYLIFNLIVNILEIIKVW